MHSVLVLGGYGFFGKRICAALAREPAIKLYIAGRDRSQAAALTAALDLPNAQAIGIDAHSAAFAGRLSELGVNQRLKRAATTSISPTDAPLLAASLTWMKPRASAA